MKEKIEPHFEIIELAENAAEIDEKLAAA